MKTVFIGGSRRISRLSSDVRDRLDNMVAHNLQILIGDADGADRAVQQYLSNCHYENVQVFCMKGDCRNNVGVWPIVEVSAPKGVKGAEFYSLKDQEMTLKASVGLMLWDGKSAGTLANIVRLLELQKPVLVYQAKLHELRTIRLLTTFIRYSLEADLGGRTTKGHDEPIAPESYVQSQPRSSPEDTIVSASILIAAIAIFRAAVGGVIEGEQCRRKAVSF